MEGKVIKSILVISFFLIIGTIGFFLYLGIGFGEAVVDAAKGVNQFQKELKEEGVNHIDSVKLELNKIIDTTGVTIK